MKFNMKHFPFLFIILFILSCDRKNNQIENDEAKTYINKACFYRDSLIKLDSSFYYFKKAKLKTKDYQADRMIYILGEMAKIEHKTGLYFESEATATEAFAFFKNCESREYIQSIYSVLGVNYLALENYDKALEFYNKCLNDSTLIKEIYKVQMQNNIAVVYIEKKNFKKAIDILYPLHKNSTLKSDRTEYSRILDNLGYAYLEIGKKNEAYKYLKESLRISDSLKNDFQKIAPLIHLSKFYQNENIDLAKEYAKKAYTSATSVNNPEDRIESLDLILKNSEIKHHKKYYLKINSIRDSLDFARKTSKNQFANVKFNLEEETKNKEKEKAQKILITYLFLGFGVITILIYFLIRSKNKRKLQKSTYETETRISKQLHDELANDVFNVMIQMQTEDFSNTNHKEKIVNQLETIYKRTRNISIENSEIDTGEQFDEHLKSLISSFNSESVNVIIRNFDAVDWKKTKELTKIAIYRAIQELLVNMKKHSQCNLAVISFENKDNQYQITYSDNGVFGQKTLKLKNGLSNMENRIKNIKGTITFEAENQKGFKVKINFPK